MKSLKSAASIAVGSLLISASSLLACEIPVDIHPTSCPNPINVGSNGLVPAAILGTGLSWMDVRLINPLDDRGITMRAYDSNGDLIRDKDGNVITVKAVKARFEDVATPFGDMVNVDGMWTYISDLDCDNEYSCTTNGPDGLEDLSLKFPTQSRINKKTGEVLPGVADLLVGLASGETRCIEIEAWEYPREDGYTARMHGKDVIIVKAGEE